MCVLFLYVCACMGSDMDLCLTLVAMPLGWFMMLSVFVGSTLLVLSEMPKFLLDGLV